LVFSRKGTSIDVEKFTKELIKKLWLFYNFDVNKTKLIFCSDGARVFKKIRNNLGKIFKNSKFILDKFHGFQKINKAFPKYKTQQEKRNYFKNLFYFR
jgi:hypothetical protein